jgi:hypothetical protein
MTRVLHLAAAAFLMAGTVTASGVAYAASGAPMDQPILRQLSPRLRQEVRARMGHGDTAEGIIQTMLLNNIETTHGVQRVISTNFRTGQVTVEDAGGQRQTLPFNPSTLQLENQSASSAAGGASQGAADQGVTPWHPTVG